MKKNIVCIVLVTITLVSFASCSFDDTMDNVTFGLWDRFTAEEYSNDKRDIVEWIDDEEGITTGIVYNGVKYVQDNTPFFSVNVQQTEPDGPFAEDDVLLSWSGMRLGYTNHFYSDTYDQPLFIYTPRLMYWFFREDYNPMEDKFILEGTNVCFSVSEFDNYIHREPFDGSPNINVKDKIKIVLRSKTHNRIKFVLSIYEVSGVWYADMTNLSYYCELKPSVVQKLIDAEVIEGTEIPSNSSDNS